MSNPEEPRPTDERSVHGYNRMMERVKAMAEKAEKNTVLPLQHAIDAAADKAVELGELTREEADRIADYLRRDLHDAGEYVASTGSELGDWLRFDLDLIEDRLRDIFAAAVDQTRIELMQLQNRAPASWEYHTGEIAGVGTLICAECGKALHFHTTSRIPPCPACHRTVFVRVPEAGEGQRMPQSSDGQD
jgi:hypothetical protein